MARPKAKEPEKDPWFWVSSCSNPLEVTDEHVKTVYRINVQRCSNKQHKRNCKLNPYCLSRLGEEKWSDAKYFAGDSVNDPEKERRSENTYVGLKNLGATCYVNSLLQLWFHNLNFRKAIFLWDPAQGPLSEDQEESDAVVAEKTIMKHLQSVFALMQYGFRRYVDPTDFILSLRLDTTIQQDAQEFSKLFLSKLESLLSYQPLKHVRDLIKDNFCGEYAYVTSCMRCRKESRRPSKFYELDLNIIKGHKTIQDCLKDFMKVEILEGDNKYFCTSCENKEDAQRYISLTELPPVLNLQLMRFFYDKNTGHKKKLNTAIQFPERLNMAEFVPNVKGDLEYSLSAVLVHGGRSANSGHYIALICDSETGIWYKFNDESVEKIDAKKLKFAIEDECDETTTSKKNKVPKSPPKGSYHSINAYMLVYTRVNSQEGTTNAEVAPRSEEWRLPPHLQEFVSAENEKFESWVLQMKHINDATVGRTLDQQEEVVSMITMLPVDSCDEDFDAVPTSCITKWLNNPDNDFTIDNLKRTCEHGKLRPSDVHEVKYINSEIAERLFDRYDANHRFKASEFQCRDCVAAQCFKLRFKDKINEEFTYIQKRLKNFSPASEKSFWVGKWSLKTWRTRAKENLEHGKYNANKLSLLEDVHLPKNGTKFEEDANDHPDANKDDKENSSANQISETCCPPLQNGGSGDNVPNSIKVTSEPLKRLESSKPVAPLADSKVPNSRSYAAAAIPEKFQNQFYNFVSGREGALNDAASVKTEPVCPDAVVSVPSADAESRVVATNHSNSSTTVETESNVVVANHNTDGDRTPSSNHVDVAATPATNCVEKRQGNGGEPYLCPVDIKRRRLDDDDTSSTTEKKLFNDDILCVHSNLCIEETSKRRLVPEDVWRIYRKYFPSAKAFTSEDESCSLCKNIATEDEVTKGKYRSRAIQDKENLIELYHERSRPSLPQDIEYDCAFYILNREFFASWRRFVKEAGKKEPPQCIQNKTSLICFEHNKLLYDVNEKVPEALMIITTPNEWDYLKSHYEYDFEIKLHCLAADRLMWTEPGVCEECMRNRIEYEKQVQLTYTNAKIYVHVVKEEIVDDAVTVDESRPCKQRKLNNGTSSRATNKIPNGENGYGNTNGSNGNDDVAVCESAINSVNCNTPCTLGNTNDPLMNGNDSNNNDSNGNTLCQNFNNVPQVNGNVNGSQGVRRSARARRGDKKIEINASSDMVVLDIKKKILEMMEVMPSDQHLFTPDGRELTENTATLADMAIYPDTMLTLKVDKPCAGNDSDDFSLSREREQGFLGTILTSGPCILDRVHQNDVLS